MAGRSLMLQLCGATTKTTTLAGNTSWADVRAALTPLLADGEASVLCIEGRAITCEGDWAQAVEAHFDGGGAGEPLVLQPAAAAAACVLAGAMTTAHWVPDAQAHVCAHASCGAPFGLTKRRSHCRRCGNVFCREHCRWQRRLSLTSAEYDDTAGVAAKVCFACFEGGRTTEARRGVVRDHTLFFRSERLRLRRFRVASLTERICALSRAGSGERALSQRLVAWVPDARAPCCTLCAVPFSLFVRRTHCRLCGRVYCSAHCVPHAAVSGVKACGECVHFALSDPSQPLLERPVPTVLDEAQAQCWHQAQQAAALVEALQEALEDVLTGDVTQAGALYNALRAAIDDMRAAGEALAAACFGPVSMAANVRQAYALQSASATARAKSTWALALGQGARYTASVYRA